MDRVSLIGTVLLIALLGLFLVITLMSTTNLANQIHTLTEHPFTVSSNIADVRTNLALMRVRTERLQSYNQPEDVELVQEALAALYPETEALLAEIQQLYLGPTADTQALLASYEEIKQTHLAFLAFAKLPTSTTTVITDYEEQNLYPLYDDFDAKATTVLRYARATQQNIFNTAGQMSHTTTIWSCIIVAIMTVGLMLFQHSLKKMNRRLYQKNQQFEVLSNTIDETFMVFEPDTPACDFVSGNAEKVLGIPAEQLQQNWAQICAYMNPDDAERLRREMTLANGSAWESTVEYHPPQMLESRWLQLCIYRLADHNAPRYILTLTDRTDERRANIALQDALVSAQNANNAKKDFLSRMSHEIRTPMNAIIGMTTIAAASIEDRRRVEDCLEKISYSSTHLLRLINDVLDMSRIESDRMKLSSEPFELYQFLNNFVSVVYPQATAKGLKFTEKITGFSAHTTFLGDSLRLNQILLNLTSNAIKFTLSGGKITLTVSLLPTRGSKNWIRFVVADTGIGMDEAGLARLYTPFEQADETIAGKYGGTGLGMSITQNLVTLMGGHIHVASRPNCGTTFTVELPFARSDVELHPLQSATLETLEVLVVDDEQDICEHTTLLLKRMKIHAEWVLSGIEAVERVERAMLDGQGFDVCFIDWKMPGMDGIETTRRIRQRVGPDTPIIIISAYDWSDIEQEARAAGVNAFIAKPMFQSSIYNALVNATNGAFGASVPAQQTRGHSLDGKRLLLAEDNALNREIAVTLLEMNGATVECAENGQEAVDCFTQAGAHYFDAILMDVQMPVMDGCEATQKIRACGQADAASIPIIATTANAFAEDVATVKAAGMNAHIAKPLDMALLCSLLHTLCGAKAEAEAEV